VTMNIQSIIDDGNKMQAFGGGIVAFTLFPVPSADNRWKEYLHRIGDGLGLPLSEAEHCTRVHVTLDGGHRTEIVVCSFWTHAAT
jgi:hypothetical protein